MKHLDISGCILPHQTHIFASPNERKFITCQVEHANSKCHKWTIVAPKLSPSLPLQSLTMDVDTEPSFSSLITPPPLKSPKPFSSSGKRISPFVSPTSVKKQKMFTVGLDGTITVEKTVKVKNTKTSTNATITIKNNKRLTFKPINQLLDPTVQVLQDPASSAEKHAQNSCYSFVLSGCSKEVSNNTTIEFYNKHIDHLKNQHQEHLGHLNVDNKALPSLHSIKGGSMDRHKLAVDLMNVINDIKPVSRESAFSQFIKDSALGDRPEGVVSPPEYFKYYTVINIDYDVRKMEVLFHNWPVCIAADGCAINSAAVEVLVNKIGLLSPGTRCSAHAAHGSERGLATSKTMPVQEVVEYATNLRPNLKHFKKSGKSLRLLNDALKLLEMKKMKTLVWWPTCMGYILTSSKRCTELLVPLADVLASCDIKKENTSYFLSPKCIAIILGDVEEAFMEKFIRQLDGDN